MTWVAGLGGRHVPVPAHHRRIVPYIRGTLRGTGRRGMTDTVARSSTKPGRGSRPHRNRTNLVLLGLLIVCAVVWAPAIVIVVTSLKPPGGLIGTNPLELPEIPAPGQLPGRVDPGRLQPVHAQQRDHLCHQGPPGAAGVGDDSLWSQPVPLPLPTSLVLLVVAGAMVPLQIPAHPAVHDPHPGPPDTPTWASSPRTSPSRCLSRSILLTTFSRHSEGGRGRRACGRLWSMAAISGPCCCLDELILVSLAILDLVGTWNEFPIALTVILEMIAGPCPLACPSRAPTPASSPSSARRWSSRPCRSWSST